MCITTERLVLKPFDAADDAALAALLRNEQIKKTYMVPDFEDEAQYRNLAERFRALSLEERRFAAGIYLEDKLIGFFNDVGIENGRIELGYVIDPAYHNRGFATEALEGAIDYLLKKGFREVITGAFESNAASIRVMEKAGMMRISQTDEIQYRGECHRCVYYCARRDR